MKTVGAYEAKTHLAQLLNEVVAGETVVITRRGAPIARLVPSANGIRPDTDAAVDALHEFRRRENITLGGIAIRELIEEGRRY